MMLIPTKAPLLIVTKVHEAGFHTRSKIILFRAFLKGSMFAFLLQIFRKRTTEGDRTLHGKMILVLVMFNVR